MNHLKYLLLIIIALSTLTNCTSGNEKSGKALLDQAKEAMDKSDYDNALILLDSLHRSYPDAVKARKEALTLSEQAKLERSRRDSSYLAPRLEQLKVMVDSLNLSFITERNDELSHQVKRYKGFDPSSNPTQPYIDFYFNNEGRPEMVVATAAAQPLLSQLVKISNKATGDYVLSDTLMYDGGTNYRFEDGGIKYERLTYTDDNAERLASFIASSAKADGIEVVIAGEKGGHRSFTLNSNAIEAIRSTYDLYKLESEMDEIEQRLINHQKRLKGIKSHRQP